MCFKRRDRSEKSNKVLEGKGKRKEEVPPTQHTVSTPAIAIQNPALTPVIERQNPTSTPITAHHKRLGISPVSRSKMAEMKQDRQKFEERIELEDVIKRIQDGKKQAWEIKQQAGEPLTDVQIRDKEIAEAEWRWIFRRNRAFQLGQDYKTNKFLEIYMKDLEMRGFDEELRKAQTLVSRPYLYELMKAEKKAAETRYYNRIRGLPVPSYKSLGIEFSKFETRLNRTEPEPMCQDWKKRLSTTQTDIEMPKKKKMKTKKYVQDKSLQPYSDENQE